MTQRDELLRQLKKYVEHDPRCTTRTKGSDYGCSCGLQELLTRPEARGETPDDEQSREAQAQLSKVLKGDIEGVRWMIQTAIDYHHVKEAEADAMDYAESACWHEQRRKDMERELSAKRERVFPIMGAPDIPWSLIAPWEETAKRNHGGQSLERLAQRGGLAPHEAVAVITGQPCEPMDTEKAIRRLLSIVQERTAKREGFVWVPREATPEMWEAFDTARIPPFAGAQSVNVQMFHDFRYRYAALIAAATKENEHG